MQLQLEITIARDRLFVWRQFDDPEKRSRWQENLQEIEYVYGDAGKPGSVTQYIFNENGEKEVVEETVLERKPPGQFVARYHSSEDARRVDERFETIGGNQTRWIRLVDVRAHSLLGRVRNALFKGGIEREMSAEMERFKRMVERGG